MHLLKHGSKVAPQERKRRKVQIAGSRQEWMEQTGRSSELPKSQQLGSAFESVNEPMAGEDKGNAAEMSEMNENRPSQYVSKRKGMKTREKEGLMM